MGYFNYHAAAHRLIAQGRLSGFYYTRDHKGIGPALVLLFDDVRHPVMPIRPAHWPEYEALLRGRAEAQEPRDFLT